jgi:hypothetical protein
LPVKDMALDGVAGEVLYPSQGLFYFKVADTPLMSDEQAKIAGGNIALVYDFDVARLTVPA